MGTVLNYLWQGALVLMPFVFSYFKASEVSDNKWGKILLPLAETTWNAVEAWKKTDNSGKVAPAVAEAEFMRRMEAVKGLSVDDRNKLAAWASTRSLAAKRLAN